MPSADDAYRAAVVAARGEPLASGRHGAARGATVGSWKGREHAVPGGVGVATAAVGEARLAAVAVVNAFGDVVADDGTVLAGTRAPADAEPFPGLGVAAREHTTLLVVVSDARLDKTGCTLVARSGHDGLARAVRPAHTRFDGDLVVVLASGRVEAHLDRLREAAAATVADAVRAAVTENGGDREG